MKHQPAQPVSIAVDGGRSVCGLLLVPERARACYLLAHGAGAGMAHPFMQAVADGLAERDVATLRYQFPYMQEAGRRPDPPRLAQAAVRAAAAEAVRLLPELALLAGGKSFGGRMTSQAQAAAPLPRVRGLAFLGFPLHPPRQPSEARARHLFDVHVPMLFMQGSRDALADVALMTGVTRRLGPRAMLHLLADADHSFRAPARSGREDADILRETLDALAAWMISVISPDEQS
ncbi:MAG TPA: alpha/beta family hydrolase [Xanthobacteraceae bacterium]|jgi:hypothetical protein